MKVLLHRILCFLGMHYLIIKKKYITVSLADCEYCKKEYVLTPFGTYSKKKLENYKE